MRLRLQLVEEVEDDLTERHVVAQLDAVLAEVIHAEERPASGLAQLHDGTHVVLGQQDADLHHRFRNLGDTAVGVFAGVGDRHGFSGVGRDRVGHRRRRGDEVEAELAGQTLGDDFEVQEAEESATESKAQRHRGLGLVLQRSVRELELVERFAQIRVVAAVDRVDAREDHGLRVGVARECVGCRLSLVRDCVADLRLADIFHARDQIADLPDAKTLGRGRLGAGDPDLEQIVRRPR